LSGPNGIGAASFSVPQGVTNTPITVTAARLDSSLNFVEAQQVRGGLNVTVPVSSSTPAVGTVSPTSVTISGGQSAGTTTFSALTTGSTTLSAGVPAGFVLPAQGFNTVVANVTPAGLVAPTVTVGENLETTTRVLLNSPSTGITVTITSNDPSKVLFSTTPEAAGQASIQLNVPPGVTATPLFFVHGLANSGSVTYSAVGNGFGSAVGTVNLARSGFVIETPSTDFLITSGASNIDVTVVPYLLDAGSNPLTPQQVRGGLTVNVPVTSSNPAVGAITISPLQFTGGSSFAVTQFDPMTAGATNITVGTPAGFSVPASGAVRTATVITPALNITDGVTIGRNLQLPGLVLLGQPAPAGGTAVQLTSNSGQLRLSALPTTAGSASITVVVPEGQSSATFYLQALGNSGTATYTATAPGYSPRTGTIAMAPSGVVITGPFGFVPFPLIAPLNSGPQPFTVWTAVLDPGTNAPVETQALAGGMNLSVDLTNSNPAIGTATSPVGIAGGSDSGVGQFVPLAVGDTVLSVLTPAGFTQATTFTTLTARVTP
jgi:hypothetical protein